MAITVPWSAELTRLEDLRDVTLGSAGAAVANKMLLFLASGVDPGKRQQIVGQLEMLRSAYHDKQGFKQSGDHAVRIGYPGGDKGSVVIDAGPIGSGQIGLMISSTFYTAGTPTGTAEASQWFDETLTQLIQAYLQESVDN